MDKNIILFLIALVLVVLGFILIKRHFKSLKIPNVYLITGAVKTGKSALSVKIAIRQYRSNLLKWYVRYPFLKLFRKKIPLKPMLYSNIPLTVKHNLLTIDIIRRIVRIPNKSIVLIDEASLLADSMLFKDKKINDEILLFVKLFGHYSHGGTLIFNSHTCSDLHYAIKRGVGRYLYIYTSIKYPFVTVCHCREMVYSDDTSQVNFTGEDIELSMRKIFYFNFIYKYYDCYCYSCFTDDKLIQVNYKVKRDLKRDLKARQIVSFNPIYKKLGGSDDD